MIPNPVRLTSLLLIALLALPMVLHQPHVIGGRVPLFPRALERDVQ